MAKIISTMREGRYILHGNRVEFRQPVEDTYRIEVINDHLNEAVVLILSRAELDMLLCRLIDPESKLL